MQKEDKLLKKRIFLTGGHAATPAYATIQELRKSKDIDWDIFWIGSRKAVEGKNDPTLESYIFPKIGVHFIHLTTGRVQRKFTIWTIPSLMKIPVGFVNAFILLIKYKPSIILSFGGFTSFPVVVVGWVFRIPIILHEQTVAVGRANQFSSRFAKVIAISRLESKKYFPTNKTVLVGNPISDEIKKIKLKTKLIGRPTLLITGGSRGSVFINDLVSESLIKLLTKYYVIHQTGTHQYKKFVDIRNKFDISLRRNYEVHGIVYPWDWYKLIEKSDILVSRSGANTVSEIITVKRPTLFIPIPFSYLDEQNRNAVFAEDYGIGKVCDQRNLNADTFLREIDTMISSWSTYINGTVGKLSPDWDASKKLVELIHSNL